MNQSAKCLCFFRPQTSDEENANYATIIDAVSSVSRYGASFFSTLSLLVLLLYNVHSVLNLLSRSPYR